MVGRIRIRDGLRTAGIDRSCLASCFSTYAYEHSQTDMMCPLLQEEQLWKELLRPFLLNL